MDDDDENHNHHSSSSGDGYPVSPPPEKQRRMGGIGGDFDENGMIENDNTMPIKEERDDFLSDGVMIPAS